MKQLAFTPTEEQQRIINAVNYEHSTDVIKVVAGPGTGKTTTLRLIVSRCYHKGPFLFLSFQRGLVETFSSSCDARTFHSVALGMLRQRARGDDMSAICEQSPAIIKQQIKTARVPQVNYSAKV